MDVKDAVTMDVTCGVNVEFKGAVNWLMWI